MKPCMEIVLYQLKKDVDAEGYRKYVNLLQEALTGKEGFIKREVFYNAETGVWIEAVQWQSVEAAKRCEASLMQELFMQEAMTLIDTSTLQLHLVHPVM